MSDIHKATLQKANAAISKGDFDGFLALCTDDTQWTFVGDKTIEGKEAVRRWMTATYLEPPDFEVHDMIADANFVVAIGEITLRDPQGKSARNAYCDVWRFRDGKMAELRAYVNGPL